MKLVILQSVTGGLSRNDYTIEDAFEDYLRIKKEEVPDKIHKQKVRYERVLGYLIESIGEKRNLVSINRQDAQRVRDDLLEKGQKPPTVSRYLAHHYRRLLKRLISTERARKRHRHVRYCLSCSNRSSSMPIASCASALRLPRFMAMCQSAVEF